MRINIAQVYPMLAWPYMIEALRKRSSLRKQVAAWSTAKSVSLRPEVEDRSAAHR